MRGIPYNTARGAASSLQMSPPFAFSDVTMSVFPLRASLARLDTFCQNYLNQAPELVQFKPFVPFVYLVILDYGRMSLQAANMGWVSQREVAFGIPLRWLNNGPEGLAFHDWAFTSPFIFVDNEMSMSTGREVYGWPKLLAKLDPSVSEWVRDPHGARRVFQVSTKRAAHAFTGETQEYHPFLSVYQHRAAGLFDVPPSMDTITKPIQQFSSNAAGFARLGADLVKTFAGMASDGITGSPVLPDFADQDTFRENLSRDKLRAWASPKDWLPGMRDMLWSLFPRTYANTINFKQFRDAGDPHATCYQAITSARMPVKSVTRGGFLGPQNMMLGQLDGGFRIDVHSLAGLPIVESLGLEVAQEHEANGTHVSSLTPVCPLWMQVDMDYGLADTLVWRGIKDRWAPGSYLRQLARSKAATASPSDAAVPPPSPPKPDKPASELKQPGKDEPDDAFDLDYIKTMNFFNTARGATEAVGGSFTMPNASIRVLPIKADHAALNRFASEYLNVKKHLKFEAWGDFVYIIICDFDQMNSTMNAISKRRAREINLAVPVKCYDWFDDRKFEDYDPDDPRLAYEKAKMHMVTTGFVSAFSYVDDIGSAITASEVSGIPTMSSAIKSPENDWLSLDLSKDRARRDILDVTAQVLPALMSGAQAQERSIIQLHSYTPPHIRTRENWQHSVNKWVGLLAKDIQAKQDEKANGALELGQGFVLQLLGGDLGLNQFSLKQFRDSRETGNACYQGLVQRRHRIQKLIDMRELEEPLHVSITDYPTQPIAELLGLRPKFSYPGPDCLVQVFEALRPFSITADLVRDAGNTLFERAKSDVWQRGETVEQLFGWDHSEGERAKEVIAKADMFDAQHPVELCYTCTLPDRSKGPFHLHSRKVSSGFLRGGFKRHLETGEVTSLSIRERFETGKIRVVTDKKLLNSVSKGDGLSIAAFNAQLMDAGRAEEFTQADAAGLMSLISPATITDSVLSRQWGLSQGSPRRYHQKPDFCLPAQTVPNQFIDPLFPRLERLHGYWPLTRSYFKAELHRRSSEVLSFRTELLTFVSFVGAFLGMSVNLNTGSRAPADDFKQRVADMRLILTPDEKARFAAMVKTITKSDEPWDEKYVQLFNAFADSILPSSVRGGDEFSQRALMTRVMDEPLLVTAADWKVIEAALPRLIQMAADLFEGDFDQGGPDQSDGIRDMTESIVERAQRNRKEMEELEAAFVGDLLEHRFYLDDSAHVLENRLSKLVTGGVIGG